jgi:hypothetical protein
MGSRGRLNYPPREIYYIEEDHLASERCSTYSRGFLNLRDFGIINPTDVCRLGAWVVN